MRRWSGAYGVIAGFEWWEVAGELIVLPLNAIEAAIAGRIYPQLKARGKLVDTHDILIAGICVANDRPLYTKNIAHFSQIKDLRLLSANEILTSESG